MKHLIKDTELIAYLEDTLSKEEVRQLKNKLKDNGELSLLYHLQLSYEAGLESYAEELIGVDNFRVKSRRRSPAVNLNFNRQFGIAADKKFPENK